MSLVRSIGVLLLAASFSGAAPAQKSIVVDDEAIFAAVDKVLRDARALGAARITVRSRDGFVTLSGFADTQEDIATAGRLAAAVRGVIGVSNRIRVADRPSRA